ncbi:c-type cytochrome [Chondrinema litorale]|uniref:c-type cytochrome n=1 Tax=Chondrinema litorale TaxID=2994555 RepID=UPI002542ED70|nr:cytochrome c [Chondrinema litorale]UZR93343.1 cytochrome c [Chondrinema litorale]
MFTGLLHTHKLVVVLFLLIYIIKTVLLLIGKTENLEMFTKKVKVPEMIISFLFLVTGAVMLFQLPEIKTLLIIKIIGVFASIPLAVIGFKKKNKLLAVLSLILLFGAYGLAEVNKRRVAIAPVSADVVTDEADASYDPLVHGKAIFETNCVACHGPAGDLNAVGAKNLQTSELSDEEVSTVIRNGKNAMPPYGKVLNETEVDALVEYVKSMRK